MNTTNTRGIECVRLRICVILAAANKDDVELQRAQASLAEMTPADFAAADQIAREANQRALL